MVTSHTGGMNDTGLNPPGSTAPLNVTIIQLSFFQLTVFCVSLWSCGTQYLKEIIFRLVVFDFLLKIRI